MAYTKTSKKIGSKINAKTPKIRSNKNNLRKGKPSS